MHLPRTDANADADAALALNAAVAAQLADARHAGALAAAAPAAQPAAALALAAALAALAALAAYAARLRPDGRGLLHDRERLLRRQPRLDQERVRGRRHGAWPVRSDRE